ncbi:MAG TPA: hypothetical protein VGM33_08965 [Baekduia sp.]|jgi:hypothetical protein
MSPHRSRATLVVAVFASVVLVALLAGMALASSGPRHSAAGGYGPPQGTPGHGYGYGYGYGHGYGGYGYGSGGGSHAGDRWDVPGVVYDQERYDAGVQSGLSSRAARTAAALPGAEVVLQRTPVDGGDYADVPAAGLTPARNPQTTSAAGHFVWLIGGQGRLRVRASLAGYTTAYSTTRTLTSTGDLDVALQPVHQDPPSVPDAGTHHDDVTPAAPAPTPAQPAPVTTPSPITGLGIANRPVVKKTTTVSCARKKGAARTTCLRAQKLATALKACRKQKGSKRSVCERKARALSRCDAKGGKQRTSCRRKALAIGRVRGH